MADISRIQVDSTTYNLKDARLPAPGADGTTLVADDGAWTVGTVGGDSPVESGTGAGSVQTKAYTVDSTTYTQTASGQGAFAEGRNTTAYGYCSHAEGDNTRAIGSDSHAEGNGSKANGIYSHAEGYQTQAGGTSHAEGQSTASDTLSHSEGYYTAASTNSHAEGYRVASVGGDGGAHAEGVGSYYELVPTAVSGYNVTFSSIPTEINDTFNIALDINNGSIYRITSVNRTNNQMQFTTHFTESTTIAGHTLRFYPYCAFGDGAHLEGKYCKALMSGAHAEGEFTEALGSDSHAEGFYTIAKGATQHVQGKYNIKDTTNTYAHIVGNGTTNSDRSNAHTLDWNGNAWYAGTVSAGTVANPAPVTNDNDLTTKSYVDTAITDIDFPFEKGSVTSSIKRPDYYYAGNSIWYRQTASGVGSFSSGSNTTASGKFSHAEGLGSTASGDASHAEGEATAQGYRSHAEGSATSIGINSHAEGFGRASGQASHAEGSGQTGASAYASHAEGSATHTDKSFAHSEGKNTIAHAEASHAEGYNGYTLGNYSHVEGVASNPINLTIASGSGTESDPYISQNISGSIKAGQLVVINENNYSWIESVNISAHSFTIENASSYTINAGDTVVVYVGCVASYGAHAEGDNTNAKGSNSHTEGSGTQTTGTGSHAEGSYTQAVGSYSHSEGSACVTNGAHSHAEGGNTKTSGYYSHAEGQYGIATGNASHVEGANTSINYDYISFSANVSGNTYTTASSIAVNNKLQVGCILSSSVNGSDGYTVTAIDRTNNTVTFSDPLPDLSRNYYIFCLAATGEGSHAEGKSVAIGKGSHAEGLNCYTYGHYAHAEGVGTIANSNYQHVDGHYNIADSSGTGTYVHITGIGHSENDRKNGFTINDVGNGWFAGNITANGGSLTLHDSTGDVTVTAAQLRQLLAMLS